MPTRRPLNFKSALPLEGCGDAFLGQENKKYEETMSFLSQVPLFMRSLGAVRSAGKDKMIKMGMSFEPSAM